MKMAIKIACMVLGLLGFAFLAIYNSYTPRSVVLRSPISLEAKQTISSKFNVDEGYDYFIKIRFHHIPDKITLCFFGQGSAYPFYPEHCDSKPVLRVIWKLVGDGVLVAKGNGSEFSGSIVLEDKDTVATRVVGAVDLRQGVQYYLVMFPQNEMSSLKKFDPELMVEATPGLRMRGAFITPPVLFLSLFLILGGIVALFLDQHK